jgi:hypothetical protein
MGREAENGAVIRVAANNSRARLVPAALRSFCSRRQKPRFYAGLLHKPSEGLEPSTPSL